MNFFQAGRGIDDADPDRLQSRLRQIGGAHPLEEPLLLALEPVERLSRPAEALARHVVGAVEHQGPVGREAGMGG